MLQTELFSLCFQAQMFEERIGSPSKILVLEVHEEVLKGRLKAGPHQPNYKTVIITITNKNWMEKFQICITYFSHEYFHDIMNIFTWKLPLVICVSIGSAFCYRFITDSILDLWIWMANYFSHYSPIFS